MSLVHEVITKLQHIDPLVWAALAAYFAPYGQELLKRVRDFSQTSNYVLALVVIPGVIAVLSGVQNPTVMAHVPALLRVGLTASLAAVVSQLKYGLSLKPGEDLKDELATLKSQLVPPPHPTEAIPTPQNF